MWFNHIQKPPTLATLSRAVTSTAVRACAQSNSSCSDSAPVDGRWAGKPLTLMEWQRRHNAPVRLGFRTEAAIPNGHISKLPEKTARSTMIAALGDLPLLGETKGAPEI